MTGLARDGDALNAGNATMTGLTTYFELGSALHLKMSLSLYEPLPFGHEVGNKFRQLHMSYNSLNSLNGIISI